jgi:hypothetical protein
MIVAGHAIDWATQQIAVNSITSSAQREQFGWNCEAEHLGGLKISADHDGFALIAGPQRYRGSTAVTTISIIVPGVGSADTATQARTG